MEVQDFFVRPFYVSTFFVAPRKIRRLHEIRISRHKSFRMDNMKQKKVFQTSSWRHFEVSTHFCSTPVSWEGCTERRWRRWRRRFRWKSATTATRHPPCRRSSFWILLGNNPKKISSPTKLFKSWHLIELKANHLLRDKVEDDKILGKAKPGSNWTDFFYREWREGSLSKRHWRIQVTLAKCKCRKHVSEHTNLYE